MYDTNQFRLLPKRWLWKRSGVWILEVDDDSEPGTRVFFSKTGNDATDDLRQHLGESWETLVEPIVTLKTTRVYVTDHHWIDFTSWSRWRIGYYAVQTIAIACEDIDELKPLSTADDFFPVPSKGVACLRHILPQKFEAIFRGRTRNDAAFLFFSLLAIPFVRTDKPLYGPEIDGYDSEGIRITVLMKVLRKSVPFNAKLNEGCFGLILFELFAVPKNVQTS